MDTPRGRAATGPAADAAVAAGFAVSPEDLQRTAGRVAACAAQLRSVTGRWSGAVTGAGTAMPEPASTALLGEVDVALGRVLAARAHQLDDLAAGLRAAAASYTATDTSAGDAAGPIARALGEHDGPAARHGDPGGQDRSAHEHGRGPR